MTEKETHSFSAEVERVFHFMIHSLYAEKEIFLRELISNASDACDKLRYLSLTQPELLKEDSELKITITADEKAKTLTITDNGIGMNKAELIKNLGTIARSGTQDFIDKNPPPQSASAKATARQGGGGDTQLIGKFGVGFYSAFMVADKVTVTSRAAGKKKAYLWESKGAGKFSVSEASGDFPRGTSVTLHLKDAEKEFLDKHRIRHLAQLYSNYVPFPIFWLENEKLDQLNAALALWRKKKSEVTVEEYNEFYKSVSHMGVDTPWMILHHHAEGLISYNALLFIPNAKPFDLFHPDRKTRVKLYVKRVFIAEEGIDIVPHYLRFLRGVVDSDDLPLNISRETVQHNANIDKISRAITKKVLSELAKKADAEPEEYQKFWENFGGVMKEGLCEALSPRDEILEACRFRTTVSGEGLVSLKTIKERMKDGQEAIYYLTADSYDKAMQSPQLEKLRRDGIEVLLLTDSVDEFWVQVLHEYKGTPLASVTKAEKISGEKEAKKENPAFDSLLSFFKETLGEKIGEVRLTEKLDSSPVCLAAPEGGFDIRMERFLFENKQIPAMSAKILEINPHHPIIKSLQKDCADAAKKSSCEDIVKLLFAQANILEGEPVPDAAEFVSKLNELIRRAA